MKIVDEFTGRILEGRRWSRGHPPGRRGQGRGEDQGGEPDPRDDHPAELLPHVRQARRHDRHGPDRGRRADEHLRAGRGAHAHAPADGAGRPGRQDLQDRGRQVRRRGRGPRRAGRARASRCWSARSRWRSREYLSSQLRKRGVDHEVLNAKQHTREADDRRPGRPARQPSPSPRTWPVVASTSCSAATPRAWPARRSCARASRPRRSSTSSTCRRRSTSCREEYRKVRAEALARYDELLEKFTRRVQGRRRQGPRARRALRARHRAPREPAHRQPAPGSVGPPGRSGREPLLPEPRRRADAPLRHRRHELGDGQGPPRRRAHRGEDGHEGHRAGPEHRRAAQRRDPQERPQVRRGDEPAAQGHLHAPRPDPRGRRPARRRRMEELAEAVDATVETYCVADASDEWDIEGLLAELGGLLADEAHGRADRASATRTDEIEELAHGRGHRALRAPRGRARRPS